MCDGYEAFLLWKIQNSEESIHLFMMESFENRVDQVLNKARDDVASSAKKGLPEVNN